MKEKNMYEIIKKKLTVKYETRIDLLFGKWIYTRVVDSRNSMRNYLVSDTF